ncbi:MAG: SEL1-like repeat protein [Pseudomonadales bacterium]|nr:SEL1-like repeat protein [Pseudomonadales bacterium]
MRMAKQSIGRVSVLAFCIALASVSSLPLWADDRAFARSNMTQDNSNKPVFADKRVALVIGNSRYKDSPLKNPVNDAKAMRDKLSALGFDVVYREDLKQTQIGSTLSEFEQKLSAGAISVFFYAGHGLQVDGKNYLPVTDASINNEYDVPTNSLNANLILQIMDKAKSKVNILFLDACRNNPYARSFRSANSGLAPMSSPLGTIVSFATRAGETAADGNGNNGLYTEQLLKLLDKPNLPVDQMIKRASKAVIEASGGKQVPEMSVQLYDDFYLVQQSSNPQGGAIVPNMAADDTLWYSIKDSTKATDFERYIKEFATGQYVIQAKEQLAKLKPSKPVSTVSVDVNAETKALNSVRFLEELEEFVKRDVAPITTLQAQIAAGSQLAKARYCALATHERFKLGLKAEAGIDYCKELAEQGVGIGQALYGRAFANGSGVTQDRVKAIEWFRKAAEQGDANGQVNLGSMYYGQNEAQAVEWFRRAAEQGHASAQYNLGVMYVDGTGVTQDIAKAVEWYRKAAEQGHASAQYNLGVMYDEGQVETQNYAKAIEWYRKAAEQGDAGGQNNLGNMYLKGKGITKDEAKAVEWYRKAAEQGDEQGQYNLGVMYLNGTGVTQDYAKAADWYHKAAEQGYAYAQSNLGIMYEDGTGVTQDYAKAADWYHKAAEQGYASAQFNLGVMYQDGTGVAKDYAKAVEWYQKSAEQGNADAQFKLGKIYIDGDGITRDPQKGLEFLEMAMKQGNEDAIGFLSFFFKKMSNNKQMDIARVLEIIKGFAESGYAAPQMLYGTLYEFGQGVPRDYVKAVYWYRKSAEQGNVLAIKYLADMYEYGKGVRKDIKEAIRLYKIAAESGNPEAQAALTRLGQ